MNSISMEETISIMATRNSRSPLGNNNSVKRKSFENDENSPVNIAYDRQIEENSGIKKPKLNNLQPEVLSAAFTAESVVGNSTAATSKPGKSSLPRFSNKRIPSITPKVKQEPMKTREKATTSTNTTVASVQPTAIPPTTPGRNTTATNERGTDKKNQPPTISLGLVQTNTSSTVTAPQGALTPRISANPFLKKVQRELINEVTGNYFNGLYEQYITILQTEEKIQTAMASLKVKAKWDVKERMKKQENVLKELKEIIIHLQDGINQMKAQANQFEMKIQISAREVYDQLVDNVQLISSLQSNDRKLKKENESLIFDNKSIMVKYDNLKQDSQQQIREIEMAMKLQSKEKERLMEKIQDLEKQILKLNHSHDEAIQQFRSNQDKHAEEKVKLFQLEMNNLKSSYEKLQSDYSKLQYENEELVKKNSLLQDDLLQIKANLRDTEMAKDLFDRDVLRLTREVQHLKESLNKRDDDFRSSMTSAYSIQKQALEEKTALWNEFSQLNNKAQMLEDERRQLTSQIAEQKEEFSLLMKDYESLKDVKLSLEIQLSERKGDSDRVKELYMQLEIEKELKLRFESREESERRERIAAVAQLIAIQNECTKASREMEQRLQQLENMKNQEIENLKRERDQALAEGKNTAEISMGLKQEIEQLHYALEKAPVNHKFAEELSKARGEIEILKQKLLESQSNQEKLVSIDTKRVQEYEEKLQASEMARRKLHNLVQELRGNIRVFARVRPFLPGDGHDLTALPDAAITPRSDLNSLKIAKQLASNGSHHEDGRKEEYEFSFDKVFGPSISQETLFNEVAEFVQSALDGYHVCLFSYGQTGSGKTHTMNGSGDGSMRGIIPRAMEQVGAYKRQLQEKGWNYTMEISFIEIYNENIRDLLRSSNNSNNSNVNGGNNNKDKDGEYSGKHEIKKDAQGNVYVTDIAKISVDPEDFQQIISIMELAAQHRSTSCTLMNDRSSRSHAIFTLHLKAFNPIQGIELNGALNLVDLAGSERIDKSGVTGNELKEAVSINKSLSSLADVFSAIANKQSHIPFRNSKLTYLLQPALSGDGKTLMIVNLSPTEASFYESLSSLRFASQVSQCELGKPKRKLRDVTHDSNENSFVPNKRVMINTSSVPMIVDTPATLKNNNKSLQKASSFAIATPTPPVPVEKRLASTLEADQIASASKAHGVAMVEDKTPIEGKDGRATPNRVRFGGVTSIKSNTAASSSSTATSKIAKTNATSSTAPNKTGRVATPTKGKK